VPLGTIARQFSGRRGDRGGGSRVGRREVG